jgi:PPP family 3-phenylpropionic acid transporter
LFYSLISAPIVSLLDSSALELVGRFKSSFGAIRLWGSVGWAGATWLVGTLIERSDIRWLFYSWMLLVGITFLFSLFQPARTQVLRAPLKQGLRGLIRRDTILFLLSILLIAIASSGGNSFYGLFMKHIGAGEGMIGLASSVSAVCEVPLMLFSGVLIRRFGSRRLLEGGFALYVARWFLASLITTPIAAVLLNVIQGFAFAAYLTGGVTYFSERTPEGMATTAQALYNTVTFGLASIAGSLLGGYLYDYAGISNLFRVTAILALAGLGLFLLIPRLAGRNPAPTPSALRVQGG